MYSEICRVLQSCLKCSQALTAPWLMMCQKKRDKWKYLVVLACTNCWQASLLKLSLDNPSYDIARLPMYTIETLQSWRVCLTFLFLPKHSPRNILFDSNELPLKRNHHYIQRVMFHWHELQTSECIQIWSNLKEYPCSVHLKQWEVLETVSRYDNSYRAIASVSYPIYV